MRFTQWRDLAIVTFAGLALRLLVIRDPGHIVDLQTFGQWALAAADNPWDRGYEATNANYPPAALIWFEFIGRVYRALGLDDPVSLRVALKLPSVIFDCLGGLLLYAIARRFAGHGPALLAAVLFDWNPAIIYDSSLWGQNDSLTTVPSIAAVWCLLARRQALAWIVLAYATLNKPPVIVLAPLFALNALVVADPLERRRALRETGAGIAGALLCGYLLALPFYTDRSFIEVYRRMIEWYQIGSSLYPFTSANGFNIYALFAKFFTSDNLPLAGIAVKYWADTLFLALAAVILSCYWRLRDDRALLEAAFLILLGFFLTLTEMHERYLMYALAFAPALAALDRRYLWATLALTVTTWLNLEYSLTYMWVESDKPNGIDPDSFAPVLSHVCALTNIAVFVVAMQRYFGRARDPRAIAREAAI